MMKVCKNCGQKLHENTQLCVDCGGTEFDIIEGDVNNYQVNEKVITRKEIAVNGNIFLGIIGAFLCSLAGGLLYFVLHNFGFIAGICGFVIFFLSQWGYKKFSKCNNGLSTAGLITSIVLMVVIIFAAQYVSFAFDVYQGYFYFELEHLEFEFTFINCLTKLPQIMAEDQLILTSFLEDLIFAYVFGIVATIGDVMRILRVKR